jgi:RimJ/RimL family protein N-acetyltransferase
MTTTLKVNHKIRLTELRETDIPALVEYLNHPEIYKNTLTIPKPYSEKDGLNFIHLCQKLDKKYGFVVNWAVRDANEQLIGGIGRLMKLGPVAHKDEIGYWLASPFWGQGLMTETVRAFSDYLLKIEPLKRIEALVFHKNIASGRVLEKAGFVREGYLRKYYLKDQQLKDAILYAKFAD